MKQLFIKAIMGVILGAVYGVLTSGVPGIIVWGIFGLVAGIAFEATAIVTNLVDPAGLWVDGAVTWWPGGVGCCLAHYWATAGLVCLRLNPALRTLHAEARTTSRGGVRSRGFSRTPSH